MLFLTIASCLGVVDVVTLVRIWMRNLVLALDLASEFGTGAWRRLVLSPRMRGIEDTPRHSALSERVVWPRRLKLA